MAERKAVTKQLRAATAGGANRVVHATVAPNVGGTCGATEFNQASVRIVDPDGVAQDPQAFFVQFVG